jgi:hypothetical protein
MPGDRDRVVVALCAPSGHAEFAVSVRSLRELLHRTYALVPEGAESAHLDLDAGLSELLNPGSGINNEGNW